MSSHTTDIPHLTAALERFRSTRSAYLSTSDQALNELLTALAETVIALRGGQTTSDPSHLTQALMLFQATRSYNLSAADQALADLLTALGERVIALSDTAGAVPAGPPDSTAAALQSQIDVLQLMAKSQEATIMQLRAQLGPRTAGPSRWTEQTQTPPVQPPMMRPLEYWAEHVPDYGEDGQISPGQMREHLSRPRVRPEDVVLTPEDLRRIQRAERPPYRGNPNAVDPKAQVFLLAIVVLLVLSYLAFLNF
jgi:hypothetical protein